MEKNILEELQDAKLHRQLSSLILAHLRDSNLYQAASAGASATMTSLNAEAPRNRLLELVSRKQKAHQRVFQSMRHAIFQSAKNIARCAGFSPDGKFVATGSSNTSIKLFVVLIPLAIGLVLSSPWAQSDSQAVLKWFRFQKLSK